ncbi:MAG TPA: S8 family serine peptidase, partial [Thermoplasmata archaeon]|nr:S8 family serine peptidase [Thermoplasmata archaeon]
ENRGITVAPEDTFSLHVNGYSFDTRGPVSLPSALSAAPVREGHGYFLIQLVGPVKEEWRWQLESLGLEVQGYVNNNAYVVRGTLQEVSAAKGVREVQWIGTYQPAFRISPDLLSAEGLVTVNIITFAGEPVGPLIATLNKMGLKFVSVFSHDEGISVAMTREDFGLVRARVDADLLVPLARLNQVRYIEPYEEMHLTAQQEQYVLQTNASADGAGVRRIWDQGIKGEQQIISIEDSGMDYDHTMFRHSQTTVTLGAGANSIYNVTNTARRKVIRYLPMSSFRGVDPFTGGDPNAIKDTGDQFCFGGAVGHGSATSSSAAGDDTGMTPTSINDGMAPNAKLIMVDIGSMDANGCDALTYIPDDYADMFGSAYTQGARIFSNSWGGAASAYTFDASMTDRFIWNNPDALILFANGNNPPNPLVGTPATAKSVVSVSGAASSSVGGREQMGAASRGPTADGRRKPDITTIFSTTSPGSVALSDGNPSTLNSGLTGFAGTSYATPLAAGMAALARQYYIEGWYPRGIKNGVPIIPSAALLKATLAAGSVPMSQACPGGDNFYPNNAQGWGRLWLDEAMYFNGDLKKMFVVDQTSGIATGDTLEYRVRVATTPGRFRAFLAWSDFPGIEGANPALVNNLDLEVIDPNSVTYKGNVRGTCSSGQTLTGGAFDTLNNLEGVVRIAPAVGEWRVRVVGTNVPMGPQRFALVILADLDRTFGTVTIDRTVYNEADTVSIQVVDSDASSASVFVASNTEPAGETIALSEPVAGANIWRGTIQTHYGTPAADGKIQVSHGDTVTVTYNDINPAHASTASARVEIDPPAISNVRVTGVTNAAATVTWTTDKPSDGAVYYGTTPGLGSTVLDTTVTVSHSVTLTGLTTDTQYYFDVASTRVGRTTRDSNGGIHYAFRTTQKAEILLVVGETSFTAERLAMYRSALAGASWSWNEWDVARQGDPPVATLREYKVVLWQSGLEQYPPISDSQVTLLTTYINGGGRLMTSGHDIGWAACDPGSTYATPSRCNFVRSLLKA